MKYNTDIDVSLIKNSLKNSDIDISNPPLNTKDPKTKIDVYDFFSINEIKISNKIQKIPYYSNYYEVISNYQFMKIGEMDEIVFESINTKTNETNESNEKNEKYLFMEYNNKKETKNLDFNVFLFNLPSPKLLIFHVLDSYSYLLDSLIKINKKSICFFNLCPENILFMQNYKPLLKNFQFSLLTNSLNIDYIRSIIKKIDNYTHKPLEIHLLFYLIANNETSISYSLIDTICQNYIDHMDILCFFSQTYKNEFKKDCEDFLKKYINRTINEIIQDILLYYDKWDNFSLSMIYIYIFGHICRCFSLKDTFVNKIVILLSKNIHPNPFKREILINTRKTYDLLISNYSDWAFVNKIPSEKLDELYEMLNI
jgi:hypothetical protein